MGAQENYLKINFRIPSTFLRYHDDIRYVLTALSPTADILKHAQSSLTGYI